MDRDGNHRLIQRTFARKKKRYMTHSMTSTIDPAYIAVIVRQVIARLGQSPSTATGNTQTNHTAASVGDKIVTATTIEQLTGTPNQLFISAKAIVTPAAKDAARERSLTITRSVELPPDQVPNQATQPTSTPVSDSTEPMRATAVSNQLARRGITTASQQIVLSDTPAADVYRICSEGSERAVMIGSVSDVDRFASELRPTVWVLDMKRLNLTAAVNAAAKICQQ